MTKYDNPITIKKETSPYMYLSEYSGILVNENNLGSTDIGIRIPINENLKPDCNLVSLQFWVRFPKPSFNFGSGKILSIFGNGYQFQMNFFPESGGKRAQIELGISPTTPNNAFTVYQNGIETNTPTLMPMEWTSFHIFFTPPLSFTSHAGNIVLHKNFVFNNISQYIYESAVEQNSYAFSLVWSQILTPDLAVPSVTNTWSEISAVGTWSEAASTIVFVTESFLNGEYIYNDQTGTSVLVVDDLSTMQIRSTGSDIFTNVEWVTIEKTLV